MKKILALAVGMLLIPFTAFGMEMMSDSDMDSITGQSGVAISLDNIQLFSDEGGTELWYETTNNTNGAAAVGLVYGESPQYLFINKISNPADLGGTGDGSFGAGTGTVAGGSMNAKLRGNYTALSAGEPLADGIADMGARQTASVLSIRVAGTDSNGVFSGQLEDADGNPGAYIEIGLPTLELYSAEGSYDELRIYVMGEDSYDTAGVPVGSGSLASSLGTIYTTDAGSTTAILGGRLGITSLGQVPQALTSSGLNDDLEEGPAL